MEKQNVGLTTNPIRRIRDRIINQKPLQKLTPQEWEDIQNKTMVVTCFVKINTTGFYAVDHTNPTLRVIYDGGEESSAIATDGTDWQRLTVTITPTTTSGKNNCIY